MPRPRATIASESVALARDITKEKVFVCRSYLCPIDGF